jgi:NTE family protein
MGAKTILVLSGGIGLGAYHAGAIAHLHEADCWPDWIAGASIGAICGAVVAGNRRENVVARLGELWNTDMKLGALREQPSAYWRWDHWQNWISALHARVAGSRGQFRPRMTMPWESFGSLYDLAPLHSRLDDLIDFDRLNSGDIRFTVATTDIETGDLVLFDTGKGDMIGAEHLMASCGFLPEFAPVEIGGRLLGDGGLVANAPIEALNDIDDWSGLTCLVLDLYARDGERPRDLETAMSRKSDLIFSNQTWQRLTAFRRLIELRTKLARSSGQQDSNSDASIFYLSYRPLPEEAGAERGFDYSARMLDRRWQSGEADMREALKQRATRTEAIAEGHVALHAVRRALNA